VIYSSIRGKHARIDQVLFQDRDRREAKKVEWTWTRLCALLEDGYPKKLLRGIVTSLPQTEAGDVLRERARAWTGGRD
jgi:hypothetical protein